MRAFSRWLMPMALATASLVGTVSTSSAQPHVRDHRGPRQTRPIQNASPTEAPPPIREERVRPRGRGWVWVQGYWDWRGGRWEWNGGRWEKARAGKRWRPLAWELRNGVYVRVDGDWIDDRPNQAPPPLREERFRNRRGFVWVPGHWDWQNGQYVWVNGKYERERRGKRWRQAKWELRDGVWVRVDGAWDDDVVVQYPTQAPPALRDERPGTRRGFVWIRGHYEWRNGNYEWVNGHWERERARERWVDGRWELRNGRWEWIAGRWGAPSCGADPDREPPKTFKGEALAARPGMFVVRGRWTWNASRCDFDWTPGHLERARAGYRYVPGRWGYNNARWQWIEARWEPLAGGAPPPPAGPTSAPPPPRAENPGTKGGFIWIRGHYEWRGNQYEWIPGHWERERARQRWVDGRWELRGGAYVWVPGFWR